MADEIAYNTSDLDDGLRSGTLHPAEVRELAIAQRVLNSLGEPPDADLGDSLLRHRFIRRLVGVEVSDTIQATQQNLEAAGVETLADVRRLPHNVANYSPEMQTLNAELKHYLFLNFYRHYRVVRMATKSERLLQALFTAYVVQPEQLPTETQQRVVEHPEGLHRVVCDYIAGMTDRYAIQDYKRLYDPEERA
jgi:dGTPase